MEALELAAGFAPATEEDWRRLVDGVLKGADFERKLVGRTADGLRIEPLYPKSDAVGQPWRDVHAPWRNTPRLDHPDPAAANELALAELEGGADGLAFIYAGAPSARGFGVGARSLAELDRAFAGIMLDLVAVRIETASFGGRLAAAQWTALVEKRGLDPASLDIEFGLDPIGDLARSGGLSLPWPELASRFAETVAALKAQGFVGPFARVDTRPWHEAGAGEAQELAAALATGIAYLRAHEASGMALAEAEAAISFLMVADADAFLTIAKFRALRRLWARVQAACGLAPRTLRLAAETAWRMTSRRDPYTNILRGTVAAFGAGLGGADSVTVLPFTAALGLADGFARRVARNSQAILLEESQLWRVADPAAGSGGVEALTEGLCESAWSLFQAIEAEGGMVASLGAGAFPSRIAATWQARAKDLARRRLPITGTSEFPNLREMPVALLEAPAAIPAAAASAAPPRAFNDLVAAYAGGSVFADFRPDPTLAGGALPSHRDAEAFERLRDRSDAILAATGTRPRVFLAQRGTAADFTARSMFAASLFEAGGIEAVAGEAGLAGEALAAAFAASGARIACLCSSDAIYASEAVSVAGALAAAHPALLYLAGRPTGLDAPLAAAGITHFVFAGCDAVATLTEALDLAA